MRVLEAPNLTFTTQCHGRCFIEHLAISARWRLVKSSLWQATSYDAFPTLGSLPTGFNVFDFRAWLSTIAVLGSLHRAPASRLEVPQ